MEITTNRYDDIIDLERQWEAATEGQRTLRRQIVARDRSNPNRHLVFAFFDSYESAMENSSLPATQEFASRFNEFVDSPITFQDLDVVEER